MAQRLDGILECKVATRAQVPCHAVSNEARGSEHHKTHNHHRRNVRAALEIGRARGAREPVGLREHEAKSPAGGDVVASRDFNGGIRAWEAVERQQTLREHGVEAVARERVERAGGVPTQLGIRLGTQARGRAGQRRDVDQPALGTEAAPRGGCDALRAKVREEILVTVAEAQEMTSNGRLIDADDRAAAIEEQRRNGGGACRAVRRADDRHRGQRSRDVVRRGAVVVTKIVQLAAAEGVVDACRQARVRHRWRPLRRDQRCVEALRCGIHAEAQIRVRVHGDPVAEEIAGEVVARHYTRARGRCERDLCARAAEVQGPGRLGGIFEGGDQPVQQVVRCDPAVGALLSARQCRGTRLAVVCGLLAHRRADGLENAVRRPRVALGQHAHTCRRTQEDR
eukprot:m.16796 g.16796  ORF g.16796 m.16796 type:complete len:397 (-) comp3178_c0_seq1:374-1564(-)